MLLICCLVVARYRPVNSLQAAIEWAKSRQFALAITLSIVVAFALTCLSLWIYHINDVSRLDISRPGYEVVRESVQRDTTGSTFEATGNLDKKSIDTFKTEFAAKRKLLDGNSRFDPQVISDDELKLNPPSLDQTE